VKLQSFYEASKDLEAYKLGETPEELAARLRMLRSEVLKLDANENLFLPQMMVKEILREASEETDPRLYPSGESKRLREDLGGYLGVSPRQVVLGGGSDQLIELLLHAFLRAGDEMLAVTPTFSVYGLTARAMGVGYRTVDLGEDFSLNVEEILSAVSPRTRILVLCSPNNPTGNQFVRDEVLNLAEKFQGLVVVDEAYVEYAGYSLAEEAAGFDNMLILRTFSKAFGLAGLRLGYTVSNSDLAGVLNDRYQMPYPVSSISLKAGLVMLERIGEVRGSVAAAKRERGWLIDELNSMEGITAYASDTNFVLFSLTRDYEEVYGKLLDRGIIIRKIGPVPGVSHGCLRVTLAPRERLERFLVALKEASE
jgi:histidinol-phosphate aminotransferase